MSHRGLLLTMTEPPATMEEEFNAWYDDEHLPERLAISGFRSARRWVADVAPGEGKYLATYELDSPQVLTSPEYLARFEGATPWTRRCLDKALLFRRWACEQAGALQIRHFVASVGTPRHVALAELAWDGTPALPSPQPGWFMRLYRAYGA
jgi:hypothetical protein